MAIPALILIGLSQLLFSLNNSGLFTYLVLGSYGFFLGIVPTAIFVQVPRLAASTSAIAPIIGLTMSGQGIGVLLGPPLTGWVAAGGSQWQNCATLLSAVLVLLIFTAMTLAVATRKQLLVPQ